MKLVLRACLPDMTSHGGFVWPSSGPVECPDWKPTAECGNGLHGWLWGVGDLSVCSYWNNPDAEWLAVEVDEVVDLNGRVKFQRGNVVFCGQRHEAATYVAQRAPSGTQVMFATATAGHGGTATVGYCGTATAGDGGTATAGYRGTATAGDGGVATAGYRGTATAGDGGTATAGDGGAICIEWWCPKRNVYRRLVAKIDKDGEHKPGVAYVVCNGKLVAK